MNTKFLEVIDKISWESVYPYALELVKLAAPRVLDLCKKHKDQDIFYYNPHLDKVSYQEKPGWLWIKSSEEQRGSLQKIFGPVASATGWGPGPTASLLGGPSTLSASLGSGLIGAGLGYGAGWLTEHMLPEEDVKRGRLRKLLALVGGGVGAIPGLWAGSRGWFDKPAMEKELSSSLPLEEVIYLKKEADGSDFAPIIQRDYFNNLVYQDPFTPRPIQAATTGLVSGASSLRNNSPWISPADMGRLTAGMGSGYLSGLIVGKTLGALAGLTPEAQRTLQRAGTWAGFLNSVVPMAYGQGGQF